MEILIVDDEREVRDALDTFLALQEGYNVTTSGRGEEALKLLRQRKFEIMLLDINMPEMSGIEVLKNAKKITPELEVIMITGFNSLEKSVDARKYGASEYLLKPFEGMDEVARVVNESASRVRRWKQALHDGIEKREDLEARAEEGAFTEDEKRAYESLRKKLLEDNRILVVDDEPEVVNMIVRNFRLEGYDIEGVHGPLEALEKVKSSNFKVVICDIKMPEMNGVDLLKEIKKIDGIAQVIMITGYVTPSNIVSSLSRGANDCLFKPLDMDQLKQAVDNSLQKIERFHRIIGELRELGE